MISAICASLVVAPMSFAQVKESKKPSCCGGCPGKEKKDACKMDKSKSSTKTKTASKKAPAKKKTSTKA
jgi:hypothetical protein